jgi:hypothetical protein
MSVAKSGVLSAMALAVSMPTVRTPLDPIDANSNERKVPTKED